MIPSPTPRTVNDSPTSAATEEPVGDGFPNDLATSARAEVAPNWAKPAAAASAPVARIAGSRQPWSRKRRSGPADGLPAEVGSGVRGGLNGRTTWNTSLERDRATWTCRIGWSRGRDRQPHGGYSDQPKQPPLRGGVAPDKMVGFAGHGVSDPTAFLSQGER